MAEGAEGRGGKGEGVAGGLLSVPTPEEALLGGVAPAVGVLAAGADAGKFGVAGALLGPVGHVQGVAVAQGGGLDGLSTRFACRLVALELAWHIAAVQAGRDGQHDGQRGGVLDGLGGTLGQIGARLSAECIEW